MNYVGVALDDRFCPATLPPLACKVSAEICASDSSAMAVARLDLNRALEGRFGPEGLPLLACTVSAGTRKSDSSARSELRKSSRKLLCAW